MKLSIKEDRAHPSIPPARTWLQRHFGLACVALCLGACFTEELDPNLNGVYVCTEATDCPDGFGCVEARCVDNRGPGVEILFPEELSAIAVANSAELRLNLAFEDLELVAMGSDNANPEAGFLRVFLDQVELTQITASSDDKSIEVIIPSAWERRPGLHRIDVQAVASDGTPFSNPSARRTRLFWIDDGEIHVAIAEPRNDARLRVGEPAPIVVHALNFIFADPNEPFLATDDPSRIGHIHLFLDTPIPDCLASTACNVDYFRLMAPPTGQRTTTLQLNYTPAAGDLGNHNLSVVAQNAEHQPVPSKNPTEVAYSLVHIDVIPQNAPSSQP